MERLRVEPDRALLTDTARVREFHRYYQLRPYLVSSARTRPASADGASSSFFNPIVEAINESQYASYALTAILRCVVYEMDADICMLSLLDDSTQYFLAGANRDSGGMAESTVDSSRWFGCESVSVEGSLCKTTVSLPYRAGIPAIYEILDMKMDDRYADLPIVNGTLADYRYHAGTPITSKDGNNIGAIFMLRREPAETGLSLDQAQAFGDIAAQIMAELERSIQILDHERMTRNSLAFGSFMQDSVAKNPLNESGISPSKYNRALNSFKPGDTYNPAASVLYNCFAFDGVTFQNVDAQSDTTASEPSNHLASMVRDKEHGVPSLPRILISRLLRHYPTGHIFYFDEEHLHMSANNPRDGDEQLQTILDELRQIIPGIRQLIYSPMWDSANNRVAAVALAWSFGVNRIYTASVDLAPLTFFCNSVVAEVRRVEAMITDKKKADFLGSISHEMRSPLHGLLAGIELLQETECNAFQKELLQTSASCGRTLLDTINHILDFAGISASKPSGRATSEAFSSLAIRQAQLEQPQESIEGEQETTHPIVDLAKLCEDVVDSTSLDAVYNRSPTLGSTSPDPSQSFAQPATTENGVPDDRPAVIVDIEHRDWLYPIEAGAFRRIVMNLLVNAIKYTSSGWIKLSLQIKESANVEPSEASVQDHLLLTLADSGKGISPDYLRNELWEAFSQEDPLLPGSGLGLSLVKKIVDSMGGDIDIKSQVTVGTTVTVRIPLARSEGADEGGQPSSTFLGSDQNLVGSPSLYTRFSGRRVKLYPPNLNFEDPDLPQSERLLRESLTAILQQWFQLELIPWESTEPVDFLILDERDVKKLDEEQTIENSALWSMPRLVMCQRSGRGFWRTSVAGGTVVHKPVTLSKLARALDQLWLSTPADESSITMQTAGTTISEPSTQPSDDDAETPQATDDTHNLGQRCASPKRKHVGGGVLAESAPPPVSAAPSDGMATQPTTSSPRPQPSVLLVDDNSVNLKILAMYMKRSKISTHVSASGGRAAIEAFERHFPSSSGGISIPPFDIVFMDLSMPEINGFEATSTIRAFERQQRYLEADEKTARAPTIIVALTGLVSAQDKEAAFKAGVDLYVTKPVSHKQINDLIDMWRNGKGVSAS